MIAQSYTYLATVSIGEADNLVSEHIEYRRLEGADADRRAAYRRLFRARISETRLNEIREATNKAWALGDDRFKLRIEEQLKCRAVPRSRGGYRKSKPYRESRQINRV